MSPRHAPPHRLKRCNAIRPRAASGCLIEEVFTSTTGRSMAATQSGVLDAMGSNTHAPMWCTKSPHPGCRYSKGSPPTANSSGARRKKSSTDVTCDTPSSARMALTRGSIGRSKRCLTNGRIEASRISPTMPGRGRSPWTEWRHSAGPQIRGERRKYQPRRISGVGCRHGAPAVRVYDDRIRPDRVHRTPQVVYFEHRSPAQHVDR